MSAAVSNTISTGGGGGEFERRVGAFFLTLLLTSSFAPIFPTAIPRRVHFQARRFGWMIDDVVVETSTEAGQVHHLCAQIKRTFTLSASDDECRATISAAWQDFNNEAMFNQASDAIVLVTYLGTNRIQHDFRWLLGQARASAKESEFAQRRTGTGSLNKRAKADYETILSILYDFVGGPLPPDRVWRFLKAVHVLSFDFLDSACKDEATAKTLLASLRAEGSPADAAATTWAELINHAGAWSSEGRSVELSTLPLEIYVRHRQVASSRQAEVARLRRHSEITLRRVSAAGPRGMTFDRTDLRVALDAEFATTQVVLVVGPAGGGKSALAKQFLNDVARSETTFAFSAEEFRGAHIDEVLARASIGVAWQEFLALLPLHRKTFLVEGLERLLEANDRQAFSDLLLSVKEDPSISLVITCRDYYAEIVERSLLAPSGVAFGRVVVGGLTDGDLQGVANKVPELAPLLAIPTLKPLLRNPFILTRASEISWCSSAPLPRSERALRSRLWGDIVRRDAFVADAAPIKREDLFFRICHERAQALQPYVEVNDPDDALRLLANDNLVAFDKSRRRVAAAHDVLEDWGLAEWLTRQFDLAEGRAAGMVAAVGEFPAFRRAYRKWLVEELDSNSAGMLVFVEAVACEQAIPPYFRDDTLLAILQSDAAPGFLASLQGRLLADQAALLRRVIHLVRVGCKTVSPLAASIDVTMRWHIPSGKAWEVLLDFLAVNWADVPQPMAPLITAFLEDWVQCVSFATPYPAGSASVGCILRELLNSTEDLYGRRSAGQRLVDLLLRVPHADSQLFLDMVRRATAAQPHSEDELAEAFAKTLMKPMKSAAAVRDFPDEVHTLCLVRWFVGANESTTYEGLLREPEIAFGLRSKREYSFFPNSAQQGPFLFSLQSNPQLAVPFIVELVNEACARYAAKAAILQIIESPSYVDLRLHDGTVKTVISNGRLWRAYRGTSVMPGLVTCALMALEKWFLDAVESGRRPEVIRSYLNYILHHSNNAACLGVVASVCIAHPELAGECGISVLGCREFIRMDIERMVGDQNALAVGGLDAFARIFQQERTASNALPHRKKHLEDLAVFLQFTDSSSSVHALFDLYLTELPPEDKRTRAQSEWRLSLQRMDMRTYRAVKREDGLVELSMGELPADVQQMVAENQPAQMKFMTRLRLQNWARRVFGAPDAPEFVAWSEYLQLAKSVQAEYLAEGVDDYMYGGPNIAAAVLTRDRWDVMDPGDQAWCAATLLACLTDSPSAADGMIFSGSHPIDGSVECAAVAGAVSLKVEASAAENLLAVALTHFNDNVRNAALAGIASSVLRRNDGLFNFSLNVILASSQIRVALENEIERIPWDKRPEPHERLAEGQRRFLKARSSSWRNPVNSVDAADLDQDVQLASSLLLIFEAAPDQTLGRSVYLWLAENMRQRWEEGRGGLARERDFDFELTAVQSLAKYWVGADDEISDRLTAILSPLTETEPTELGDLFVQVMCAAEELNRAPALWRIWAALAERLNAVAWPVDGTSRRRDLDDLVRKLFLNIEWREDLREWSLLGDRYRLIDGLYAALPPDTVILEAYLHYLLHVGLKSLPEAFALIDQKWGAPIEQALQSSERARIRLDQVMSRAMFEDYRKLQQPAVRQAVLRLLDALVQAGSSSAFLLREDFVTPTGAGVAGR